MRHERANYQCGHKPQIVFYLRKEHSLMAKNQTNNTTNRSTNTTNTTQKKTTNGTQQRSTNRTTSATESKNCK